MASILISMSRMAVEVLLERCLSAALSADMLIRLFSSARTRSLTLFGVLASSLRCGSTVGWSSVVPACRRVVVRTRQPDDLRVEGVGVDRPPRAPASACGLERNPLGDEALASRSTARWDRPPGSTALAMSVSAEGPRRVGAVSGRPGRQTGQRLNVALGVPAALAPRLRCS